MGAEKQTELSEKQAEVWAFVVRHVEEFGFQPNVLEIAEHFGVTPKAILDRVAQLANKGYVDLPARRGERCLTLKLVSFTATFSDAAPAPRAARVERRGAGPAARAAMAEYLTEAGNEWTPAAVLAEAAGVDPDTAKRVLGDAPPGQFEARAQGPKKLWRLAAGPG